MNAEHLLYLVPGLGMILVAAVAVIYWRRVSRVQWRWFWAGAGLWTIAVALKILCAILTNERVIGFVKEHLPFPLQVVVGGLFVGIQSSVFEMGFTLLAVLIWRSFGLSGRRAITVGVGAGAFEAFLLGLGSVASVVAFMAGAPGTEKIGEGLASAAASIPLFWLAAPIERVIAILCHASSRALILLGVAKQRSLLVLYGFLLFTFLDGVAGAAYVAGWVGSISVWWIELAVLPFGLISVPILRWCYTRWDEPIQASAPELQADAPQT
jgi:hypothetical protein